MTLCFASFVVVFLVELFLLLNAVSASPAPTLRVTAVSHVIITYRYTLCEGANEGSPGVQAVIERGIGVQTEYWCV